MKNRITNYSYDKDGRVVSREINGKKQTYIYDLKNQLSSVRDEAGSALETYNYDASGNILEKVINGQKTNYSYDKGNQLASSTVNGLKTDYNYDAAGRMSSETTAGVTKTYTYGWLDKVTKVTDGKTETSFSYYADGQLAERVQDGKKESFYWDELALLRRGDTNYINDPAVTGGNPILADNTVLFTDMLGNTLGSVENEVFQPIGRTAFGETNSKLASANLDFFTGKPQVDGLGYNFLLRNYRSDLGKWATQDPISLASTMPSANAPILETFAEKLGYPDGWNNLAYVNNNVMNYIDWQGAGWVTVSDNYNSLFPQTNTTPWKKGVSGTSWCEQTIYKISNVVASNPKDNTIPGKSRVLTNTITFTVTEEVTDFYMDEYGNVTSQVSPNTKTYTGTGEHILMQKWKE